MHHSFRKTVVHAILFFLLLASATAIVAREESPPGFRTAEELRGAGFVSLFDGRTLDGWDVQPWHEGHWTVIDGVIDYDGQTKRRKEQDPHLWTTGSYGDFTLYVFC
jgi:hypothetical protein